MEINQKIQKVLNEQINAELYSAYLYLSMSAYCESINLKGFAHWMRVQAKEEIGHAMKIYSYTHERVGRVILAAVEQPPTEWKSTINVFEETLKHENKVTQLIHNLVELANTEKDYATNSFLKWFIDEQVEEENQANEILQQLKMIKESPQGLLILDSKLGQRKSD